MKYFQRYHIRYENHSDGMSEPVPGQMVFPGNGFTEVSGFISKVINDNTVEIVLFEPHLLSEAPLEFNLNVVSIIDEEIRPDLVLPELCEILKSAPQGLRDMWADAVRKTESLHA